MIGKHELSFGDTRDLADLALVLRHLGVGHAIDAGGLLLVEVLAVSEHVEDGGLVGEPCQHDRLDRHKVSGDQRLAVGRSDHRAQTISDVLQGVEVELLKPALDLFLCHTICWPGEVLGLDAPPGPTSRRACAAKLEGAEHVAVGPRTAQQRVELLG